jgi:hypothetical protein
MEKGNAVHSAGPNSATARCDRYSPSTGTIIAPHGWALHRRLDAVLLCVEPGGRQFAVLMLQRDDDHRDAGLQEADSPGPLASTGTSGPTVYSDSAPLNRDARAETSPRG